MNILFIRSNSVNPDSRVEKEVNALKKNGYNVDVLAWDRTSNHPLKKENLRLPCGEVPVYRIGIKSVYGAGFKKNLFPLLRFQKFIKRFLKKNIKNYDCIHACDFDTAYTSFKIAKKRKIKFTYDIFDYYVDSFSVPNILKKYIEKKDKNIINKADCTIICTEQRKEQIKGCLPKNLLVIHNSPSLEIEVNTDLYKLSSKTKIAYVGILSKGRLIEEMLEFVSKNNNYELHIGGFGFLENIVSEYDQKCDNIYFYGKLPYDKTLALEKSCDVLTAIYDPSIKNHIYAAPNKFYESLMLGKPLIMVKNTGMSDVVKDNGIGAVIDYSYEGFSKGLLVIEEKKEMWETMSITSKKLYDEIYGWKKMEDRLIEYYKKVNKEIEK